MAIKTVNFSIINQRNTQIGKYIGHVSCSKCNKPAPTGSEESVNKIHRYRKKGHWNGMEWHGVVSILERNRYNYVFPKKFQHKMSIKGLNK